MEKERARLTYAFDAYCGWCYGFGPALRRFAADNAARVDIRVLSGGLFLGDRAAPLAAHPYIPAANERIAQLTGAVFGDAYRELLADGSAVMDSAGPAVGLVALRRQAPERQVEFAGAVQQAFYRDGRDLSAPETYRTLAERLGLDPDAVTAALADPAVREEAAREMRETRRLGVQGYPTLLLHTPAGGVRRLGGPVASSDDLTAALEQHLAAGTA
ncbi:DsbA family protein [Streptomyces sp. SAJ15]|uniref:DsbA family protein n=1 Tax=Streptomyces sp. SAJ15 TaxID=2011095 RepID=UPI001184C548|nr:DsbA family protein [Streptomyces sp. SAJ15]TVL89456.1 DsbA family protein [Streptomyces sp. SAJ15]